MKYGKKSKRGFRKGKRSFRKGSGKGKGKRRLSSTYKMPRGGIRM